VIDDRHADEGREAHGEAQQVQDGLTDGADDDRPAVGAHGAHHVLGDVPGAATAGLATPLHRLGPQRLQARVRRGIRRRGAHSISDLPVRRRKTSSSDERRTSDVIGSSPSA
jgi:hypothetical protein